MTSFEIAIVLVLIWYGVIFGIICARLFSRTRRNKSSIEITNRLLDCHKMRIDGIVGRIDYLIQFIGDQTDVIHELSKEKSLCASCGSKECILQTGVIRDQCDFYSPKNDEAEKKADVGKISKLDTTISNISFILDNLILLRQIQSTGDCNICSNKDCEYKPEWGKMVRYNCPFYKETEVDNTQRIDDLNVRLKELEELVKPCQEIVKEGTNDNVNEDHGRTI